MLALMNFLIVIAWTIVGVISFMKGEISQIPAICLFVITYARGLYDFLKSVVE